MRQKESQYLANDIEEIKKLPGMDTTEGGL